MSNDPWLNYPLGKYRIQKFIATTRSSSFYLGIDEQTNETVAIKLFPPDRLAQYGSQLVQILLHNTQVASKINSPNVVPIYFGGIIENYFCIVMQFISGMSMANMLAQQGNIPYQEVLPIAQDVAKALQAGHSLGMLHLDVKPANILITEQKRTKLAEFGLAMPIDDTESIVADRVLFGHVWYISPEQICDSLAPDSRSDLYSLGATLFHLISGYPPYQGDIATILRQHVEAPIPSLRQYIPNIPEPIDQLIQKLLAKHPQERFANAQELVLVLQNFLGDSRNEYRTDVLIEVETFLLEKMALGENERVFIQNTLCALSEQEKNKNLPEEARELMEQIIVQEFMAHFGCDPSIIQKIKQCRTILQNPKFWIDNKIAQFPQLAQQIHGNLASASDTSSMAGKPESLSYPQGLSEITPAARITADIPPNISNTPIAMSVPKYTGMLPVAQNSKENDNIPVSPIVSLSKIPAKPEYLATSPSKIPNPPLNLPKTLPIKSTAQSPLLPGYAQNPLFPINQQPVNLGQQPVNLGQQPVNLGQQPVNLGQQPVNLGQQPVNLGQQPVNLGQQVVAPVVPNKIIKGTARFTSTETPIQSQNEAVAGQSFSEIRPTNTPLPNKIIKGSARFVSVETPIETQNESSSKTPYHVASDKTGRTSPESDKPVSAENEKRKQAKTPMPSKITPELAEASSRILKSSQRMSELMASQDLSKAPTKKGFGSPLKSSKFSSPLGSEFVPYSPLSTKTKSMDDQDTPQPSTLGKKFLHILFVLLIICGILYGINLIPGMNEKIANFVQEKMVEYGITSPKPAPIDSQPKYPNLLPEIQKLCQQKRFNQARLLIRRSVSLPEVEINQLMNFINKAEEPIVKKFISGLGWFGERIPVGMERTATIGEYLWTADESIMVFVPAGDFLRGVSKSPYADAVPARTIQLEEFYIDKYEVTNRQYTKFVKMTGHTNSPFYGDVNFNRAELPIVGLTWNVAYNYAKWAGKRLPTECQWEKAYRGGEWIPNWKEDPINNTISLIANPNSDRPYPWGDDTPSPQLANYKQISEASDQYIYTAPVGSFSQGTSPYLCEDMLGNVMEWCQDFYDEKYYTNSPNHNPSGPNQGTLRVCRGGDWDTERFSLLGYRRIAYHPDTTYNTVGIRLVKMKD